MEWTISHQIEDNVLLVTTKGSLDKASLWAMLKEEAELAHRYSCSRCLVDNRALTSDVILTFDIYDLTNVYSHIGLSRILKRAELSPAQFSSDFNFMETVNVNNGYKFKVFPDKESALRWLIN